MCSSLEAIKYGITTFRRNVFKIFFFFLRLQKNEFLLLQVSELHRSLLNGLTSMRNGYQSIINYQFVRTLVLELLVNWLSARRKSLLILL